MLFRIGPLAHVIQRFDPAAEIVQVALGELLPVQVVRAATAAAEVEAVRPCAVALEDSAGASYRLIHIPRVNRLFVCFGFVCFLCLEGDEVLFHKRYPSFLRFCSSAGANSQSMTFTMVSPSQFSLFSKRFRVADDVPISAATSRTPRLLAKR